MHISTSLIEALALGTPLAVEMPASNPERLAGVVILPQLESVDYRAKKEKWRARVSDRRFIVFWREYSRPHIEKDWDMVAGDGMWELKRAEVIGEQALEQLLITWNIPLEALTYLWNTDIPE